MTDEEKIILAERLPENFSMIIETPIVLNIVERLREYRNYNIAIDAMYIHTLWAGKVQQRHSYPAF